VLHVANRRLVGHLPGDMLGIGARDPGHAREDRRTEDPPAQPKRTNECERAIGKRRCCPRDPSERVLHGAIDPDGRKGREER